MMTAEKIMKGTLMLKMYGHEGTRHLMQTNHRETMGAISSLSNQVSDLRAVVDQFVNPSSSRRRGMSEEQRQQAEAKATAKAKAKAESQARREAEAKAKAKAKAIRFKQIRLENATAIVRELREEFKMDECAICLSAIAIDDTRFTVRCSHSFHMDCMTKYAERQRQPHTLIRCPVCRFDPITEFGAVGLTLCERG